MYNMGIPLLDSWAVNALRDLFAGGFIFIAGICCRFSRDNLKRGLLCLLSAGLVSLITHYFIKGGGIYFGILHLIAISVLSYYFLSNYINLILARHGILISSALFIIFSKVEKGYLDFIILRLPIMPELYTNNIFFPLGIYSSDFYSGDYFPILPWIFIFYLGVFYGVYIINNQSPRFIYNSYCPPLGIIGSHTLIIYLLHQPIIYGVLYLIAQL